MRRYNHNLEACRERVPVDLHTHTYDDRVATARLAIDAGMELCCGGILGMGETLEQRVDFAFELAELEPCEVPINLLDPRPGTPLGDSALLIAARGAAGDRAVPARPARARGCASPAAASACSASCRRWACSRAPTR